MSEDKNKKNAWDFKVEDLGEEEDEGKRSFSEKLNKRIGDGPRIEVELRRKPTKEEDLPIQKKHRRVYSGIEDSNEITFENYIKCDSKKRLLAGAVDLLFFVVLYSISRFCFGFIDGQGFSSLLGLIPYKEAVSGGLILSFINIVTLQTQSTTISKKLFNLEVLSEDGAYLPFSTALMRESLGKVISISLLPLTLAMLFLNKKGRTLHDIIAGTMVVDEQ
jgi:uncharacterized RDD family membrane protein YckC